MVHYFRHFLRHFLRLAVRNRLYTAIHIAGLAVGLAACLMIGIFVRHEISYDRNWPDAASLYQVHTVFSMPGREAMEAMSAPAPLKSALLQDFAGSIEATGRIVRVAAIFPQDQGGTITRIEEELNLVDPEVWDFFPPEVVEGNLAGHRSDVNALVLTQTFARKYFGTRSAVDQAIEVTIDGRRRTYRVVAVIADPPQESHLAWRAIGVFDPVWFAQDEWRTVSWHSAPHPTYLRLKPSASIHEIEREIAGMIDRRVPMLPFGDGVERPSQMLSFSFMNVQDLHLYWSGRGSFKPQGSIYLVVAFTGVGVLILGIAGINYVNLSTARATQRAREIALRKLVGASRGNLMIQLLGESVALSIIALIVGLAQVELGMHHFSTWLDRDLHYDVLAHPQVLAWGLTLALVVGVVGGIYPALVISGFRSGRVLGGGKTSQASHQTRLRQVLVIFQFMISSGLFVATGTLLAQTHYVRHKDLGYRYDGLLIIRGVDPSKNGQHAAALGLELQKINGVTAVAFQDFVPLEDEETNNLIFHKRNAPVNENVMLALRRIDDGFVDAFGVAMLAGRNLDRKRPADRVPPAGQSLTPASTEVSALLNLAAVKRLGYAAAHDALGQVVTRVGIPFEGLEQPMNLHIVGVIADVHVESLRREIRPEIYLFELDHCNAIALRFSPAALPQLIEDVRDVWRQHLGDAPFNYEFVDAKMAATYQHDEKVAYLLGGFAFLAVMVACLGLFGVAAFTAQRRTKEIGLRKIMGASRRSIVALLIRQFTWPVVIANVLAWPLAFYGAQSWLEGFRYRIDLVSVGPLLAAIALLISLVVAWVTVAYHALRVARQSPIHALRSE